MSEKFDGTCGCSAATMPVYEGRRHNPEHRSVNPPVVRGCSHVRHLGKRNAKGVL